MIPTKLTALIAAIAVVGVSAPAALADSGYYDPSISVSQSRGDNEISQELDQENEACTNDVKAKEKGKGDQYVDPKNKCKVYPSNYVDQDADIYDYSSTENFAEIFQFN